MWGKNSYKSLQRIFGEWDSGSKFNICTVSSVPTVFSKTNKQAKRKLENKYKQNTHTKKQLYLFNVLVCILSSDYTTNFFVEMTSVYNSIQQMLLPSSAVVARTVPGRELLWNRWSATVELESLFLKMCVFSQFPCQDSMYLPLGKWVIYPYTPPPKINQTFLQPWPASRSRKQPAHLCWYP